MIKIHPISAWIHFHVGSIINKNKYRTILDVGGVGRLKFFVNGTVTDANIKKGLDGTKLPYKNNSFDCVVSIATLEHIKKKENFLSESYRISKKLSVHWFPFGRHAEETEKFKYETGHGHLCEIPSDELVFGFLHRFSNCVFYPFVTCSDHLLLLASKYPKFNCAKTFEYVEKYANKPYGTIILIRKDA